MSVGFELLCCVCGKNMTNRLDLALKSESDRREAADEFGLPLYSGPILGVLCEPCEINITRELG